MRIGQAAFSSGAWIWGSLVLLFAAFTLAALTYSEITLLQLAMVVTSGLAVSFLFSQPAYRAVSFVLFVSVFLNLANYSFLSYARGGSEQITTEGQLIAALRLPLALLAVIVLLIKNRRGFGRYLWRNWDVLAFGLFAIVSGLFAYDRQTGLLYGVWMLLSLLTALAYLYALGTRFPTLYVGKHLAVLLALASLPMVVLAVMALPEYTPGRPLEAIYSSSNFHAYPAGTVVVALIVIGFKRDGVRIGVMRLARKVPSFVYAGIIVVAGAMMFLSGRRAATVAVGVAVVVYLLTEVQGQGDRAFRLFRIALIGGAFVLIWWLTAPLADHATHRFERAVGPSRDSSLQARVEIWNNGLELLATNPVFGVGLLNAVTLSEVIMPYSSFAGYSTHNTYLGVFIEMGIVGLLFFVLILVRSWRSYWALPSKITKSDIVLLSIPPLIVGLTEYNLTPGQVFFWPFWIAILLPRLAMLKEERKSKARPALQRAALRHGVASPLS